MVSLQTTSQQTSSSAHAGWFPSIFLDQSNFILGGTPWRFLLHHILFWCCNRIGKKYFNIDITLDKLRIASWLFLSVYFITAKFNRSFELDILYRYFNAKQLWTGIIRFWKLCFKTLSQMLQLLLELWGWFTIHLKDMNLRIEMSGETFPTALWFKSYSKNNRVLTVLWDTLYIISSN